MALSLNAEKSCRVTVFEEERDPSGNLTNYPYASLSFASSSEPPFPCDDDAYSTKHSGSGRCLPRPVI